MLLIAASKTIATMSIRKASSSIPNGRTCRSVDRLPLNSVLSVGPLAGHASTPTDSDRREAIEYAKNEAARDFQREYSPYSIVNYNKPEHPYMFGRFGEEAQDEQEWRGNLNRTSVSELEEDTEYQESMSELEEDIPGRIPLHLQSMPELEEDTGYIPLHLQDTPTTAEPEPHVPVVPVDLSLQSLLLHDAEPIEVRNVLHGGVVKRDHTKTLRSTDTSFRHRVAPRNHKNWWSTLYAQHGLDRERMAAEMYTNIQRAYDDTKDTDYVLWTLSHELDIAATKFNRVDLRGLFNAMDGRMRRYARIDTFINSLERDLSRAIRYLKIDGTELRGPEQLSPEAGRIADALTRLYARLIVDDKLKLGVPPWVALDIFSRKVLRKKWHDVKDSREDALKLVSLSGRVLNDPGLHLFKSDPEFVLTAAETSIHWATEAVGLLRQMLEEIKNELAAEQQQMQRERPLAWKIPGLDFMLRRFKPALPKYMFATQEAPDELTPVEFLTRDQRQLIEMTMLTLSRIYNDETEEQLAIQGAFEEVMTELYKEGSVNRKEELQEMLKDVPMINRQ